MITSTGRKPGQHLERGKRAFPLFYDSGLRSGEDALKALTNGADFTFFGRILQYAIAAAGEQGLHQLWEVLTQDLSIAMAQTGCINIEQAKGGVARG